MASGVGDEQPSPYLGMFGEFRNDLDQHHDRRDRCIKTSRDITAASKKIIFALQRVRNLGQPIPANIATTIKPYYDTIHASFSAIAADLQGINAHRYARNITGGLQEYMEAVSFQHYLETQQVLSLDTAERQLNQGLPWPIVISAEDYVLGLYDMTGELMRFAITNMATSGAVPQAHPSELSSETASPANRTVLSDLRELSFRLETLDSGSDGHYARDASKKLTVTKQSVDKVERAVYGLLIRGSERPKGWMPDLSEAPREEVEGL